ncbi:unnamed protein product [Paramecium sonneborni]|uniref:Uncharacterized protein n=1 Tax=Paramecium sonneborni TaxID=65129 RepID=A0A8S1JU46_9CILI|nr:unnamed protein product [Paramecium sonneborni]
MLDQALRIIEKTNYGMDKKGEIIDDIEKVQQQNLLLQPIIQVTSQNIFKVLYQIIY